MLKRSCPHCGQSSLFEDVANGHRGDIYCLSCGWRDYRYYGDAAPGYTALLHIIVKPAKAQRKQRGKIGGY